jgi:hypothetical protein
MLLAAKKLTNATSNITTEDTLIIKITVLVRIGIASTDSANNTKAKKAKAAAGVMVKAAMMMGRIIATVVRPPITSAGSSEIAIAKTSKDKKMTALSWGALARLSQKKPAQQVVITV